MTLSGISAIWRNLRRSDIVTSMFGIVSAFFQAKLLIGGQTGGWPHSNIVDVTWRDVSGV